MILHQASDDKLATEFFHRDYHDRGMLKWGGFYLSDHTSALAKMHAAERVEQAQPQQPLTEIGRELAAAWHAQQPVHLQLNILDDNQVITTVDGIVAGVNEDHIVLQLANDRFRYLTLTEIRWVAWVR